MRRIQEIAWAGLAGTLALLAGACGGVIGDVTSGGDPAPGSPGGRPGDRDDSSSDGSPLPFGTTPDTPVDPGAPVLRRLNANEYCNTLSDLLGVEERGCARFPTDGAVGFDTIGTFLSTSPLQLEQFDATIDSAVGKFLALPTEAPARRRALPCDPAAGEPVCVDLIVRTFGRLAWRRPVREDEVASYGALFARVKGSGAASEESLRALLHAMLLSPNFAFKMEPDSDPGDPTPRPLNAHELATRLSYALWASPPDDELDRAADDGRLSEPAELEAQIARMLASPRARSLVKDFAGQWLHTRELPGHETDARVYPALTAELKAAMAAQLETTFAHYLASDRNYRELISADVAVGVSDKLAAYLGLGAANPEGERALVGTERRGLLGAPGIAVLTSRGARTSFVARGVFVLDNVLCQKPPAPPPGIAPLPENPGDRTKRQISEEHRTSPSCASCHVWIDPIGLGLENFDAAGKWRTVDELGNAVQAEGELPGANPDDPPRPFSGPLELAELLGADDTFAGCVADRFLTYAIGRLMDGEEGKQWSTLVARAAQDRGGSLRDLLLAGLTSPPFTHRRGEGVAP